MHVVRAERLNGLHDEVGDLLRVASRFRWRLGCERLFLFGLRGLMGCAAAVVGLSLVTWLGAGSESMLAVYAWLVALPLVAAVGFAVVHWPSLREAALAADARLGLDERLGTAVELLAVGRLRRDGQGRRFDRLQIRDAIARASVTSGGWLMLDRRVRRDVFGVVVLISLAVGSLWLPSLPRPGILARDQTASGVDAVPLDLAQRALPFDVPAPAVAEALPPQPQTRTGAADLAARVQQAQAQRSALDALAQALGQVSAAQPAADAIQQGDFSSAQQQLANLGDEADQLSDAAKQQLARALQEAASATTQADRPLADRERQAAQALSRNNYADQRQAMHNLADQVARSGARSVPADQLARDVGQLQQQSGGQSSAARSQSSGAGADPKSGSAAPGGAPGAAGLDGQPGGAGIGSGAGSDPLGDTSSRLDSAGQRVAVPLMLGSGSGVRPSDGTEDQALNDPTAGARSVSEQVQAQQTGQVAPEQNLVPSEQRPVVRGYFQ